MAQLVLVPNPVVMAVQAGVFIAGAVIIKKLMVEPYLKVRDRREKLTVGNQGEAASILERCEEIASDINQKITVANRLAHKHKDTMQKQATAKRDEIIAAAEAEARQVLDAMTADIQEAIAKEKAKVPQVVQQLTDELFQLAVH